jgi:hypothetical protein
MRQSLGKGSVAAASVLVGSCSVPPVPSSISCCRARLVLGAQLLALKPGHAQTGWWALLAMRGRRLRQLHMQPVELLLLEREDIVLAVGVIDMIKAVVVVAVHAVDIVDVAAAGVVARTADAVGAAAAVAAVADQAVDGVDVADVGIAARTADAGGVVGDIAVVGIAPAAAAETAPNLQFLQTNTQAALEVLVGCRD